MKLTKFNLSNEIKTSFEMGQIVPFFWKDTVPGDVFKNQTRSLIRLMPLIAPVMHKVDVYQKFYYVPYRLLMDNYEEMLIDPESPLVCPTLDDLRIDMRGEILHQDNLLRSFGIHSIDGTLPKESRKFVSQFPFRAYHLIYNYYYKHPILDDTYIDNFKPRDFEDINILDIEKALYAHDYFTSNFPTTQYGSEVELDMDGNNSIFVNEMRTAEKLQRFKERLLTGAKGRYKDFLKTFFGTYPKSAVLQQPEYIGGSRQQLDIADVDQTTPDTFETHLYMSPLGSQAGKSVTRSNSQYIKFKSPEHGIILGLMYVLPRSNYISGIPREFIKHDFYSFYNPTFANLGMQETYNVELSADRKGTFGYNERYAELKYSKDVIAGDFATAQNNFWHFGRDIRREQLSKDFVTSRPNNNPFAVTEYVKEFKLSKKLYYAKAISYRFDLTVILVSTNDLISFNSTIYEELISYYPELETYVNNLEEDGDVDYEVGVFSGVKYDTVNQVYDVVVNDNAITDVTFLHDPTNLRFDAFGENGNLHGVIVYKNNVRMPLYINTDQQYHAAENIDSTVSNKKGSELSDISLSLEEVAANHVLAVCYNDCSALRPMPKFANPSIL